MNRLYIGKRGEDVGIWLTPRGKNVLNTGLDDDDFLICPTNQNLALLMNGSVHVGRNASVTVLFPEDIGEKPLVASSLSWKGIGFAPGYVNYDGEGVVDDLKEFEAKLFIGERGVKSRYAITPLTNRMAVRNKLKHADVDIRFLVFMQPL